MSVLASVLDAVKVLRAQEPDLLVAIDGRCAAGKSTLAAHLKKTLDCNVIPMDHFFLRSEQRTPSRLREPGGNVDCERFFSEVLLPIKQRSDFAYCPYNCHTNAFDAPIFIQHKAVTIVEGSYSCHPMVRQFYDLRIFLTIDPEIQLLRIAKRNGKAGVDSFREQWIPLEESYFIKHKVQEQCDLQFVMQ